MAAARSKIPPAGGLAGVLLPLRNSDSGNEVAETIAEQSMQAAVIQLAPTQQLAPCRSACCCWRWAARELLHECAVERSAAEGLRSVVDKELGNSLHQKLLNLRQEYESMVMEHRKANEEAAWLRERNRGLERERSDALGKATEVERRLRDEERAHEQSKYQMATQKRSLEERLAAAEYRPELAELQKLLHEERQNVQVHEQQVKRLSAELMALKVNRTDLEWKVQQLKLRIGHKKKASGRMEQMKSMKSVSSIGSTMSKSNTMGRMGTMGKKLTGA